MVTLAPLLELCIGLFAVLQRSSEIELATGDLDSLSIRQMVIETQDYIAQSQKKLVETIGLRDSLVGTSDGYFSMDHKIG